MTEYVKLDMEKVRNIMDKAGKSAKEVSNQMYYADSYLSHYLCGSREKWSMRNAVSLCNVLGVTLDDVIYRAPEPIKAEVVASDYANPYAEPTEAQQIITWLKVIHRDLQELGKLQIDLWK